MSKYSIILITHQDEAHIARGIAAIKAQSVADWECILVDNGSTDQTVARAEEGIAGDGRFRIERKANEGPSAARNHGYKFISAESRYIAFLDGDDWIEKNFLEVLGNYLDAHPGAGLVTCLYSKVDGEGALIGSSPSNRCVPNALGFPRRMSPEEIKTPFVTFFAITGQGPFALFRRSVLERTTLYEPSFHNHEDCDIFCQMALLAEVHALSDVLYAKRFHASNLTGEGNPNPLALSCYDAFRGKWDRVVLADEEKQRQLEEARHYYYSRHLPCRHLVVFVRCIKELRYKRTGSHLRWMGVLFSEAMRGFFLGRKKSPA
jgi:glycosyltransferase involved in cell wall biosynthesis